MKGSGAVSLSAVILALLIGATAPVHALLGLGGGAKLPDKPVIDTLSARAPGGAGKELSTSALAQKGVVVGDYGGTAAQVGSLLRRIKAKSPSPGLGAWVKIDSSSVANAHTLAGGNIIVNAGLIKALQKRADQRDALAFILAHEYSHAYFDDPSSQVGKENEANQAGQTVALVANIMKASQTSAGINATSNCSHTAGNNPAHVLAGAVMTGDWVKAELYRFSYGPFSRETETRADFLAVDLMVRAGFNPIAGSQPIETLYEKYDNSIQKRLQNQLKDVEGTIQGSLDQLGKCAPDMLKQSFNGQSLGDQLHGFLKEQIIGWTTKFLAGRFNREKVHIYASADDRVKAIHDYAAKFYPDKIVGESAGDLGKFGGGGGSAGASAFDAFTHEDGIYQSTDKITELNSQGKFDAAMKEVGKAESVSSERPLDFLVAAGTAAKGAGKTDRAIGYFEQAAAKPEAIAVVFRSLAALYVESRQTDKALDALGRGEAKIKDKKQFIVSRISIYHAKGDEKRVATLEKQCEGFKDSALTDQCHDAGEVKTAGIIGDAGKTAGNVVDQTGKTAGKAVSATGKAAGNVFHSIKNAVSGDGKKSD